MSQNIYNPLLQAGFQKINTASDIKFIDASGSEISLSQLLTNLQNLINAKVNIYQGAENKNQVVITDSEGNIATISGVVMSQAERNKLQSLNNVMIIKGLKNSEQEVYTTPNPQVGWVFLVNVGNNVYNEYCYTQDDGWQKVGSTQIGQRYINSNPSTIAVGGFPRGSTFDYTYQEMFDKLFYPSQNLSGFKILTNDSGVHEIGEIVTITNINSSYTAGTYGISSFKVWTNKNKTTLLGQVDNTNNPKLSSLSYQGNTLYAEISEKNGGTYSANWSPNFKYPYFFGVVSSNERPIRSKWDYRTMGELLSAYQARTYNVELTDANPYCFFAIPKAAGVPTSIKDDNNYEYLNTPSPDFTKFENIGINLNNVENAMYTFFVKKGKAFGKFKYTIK